jgi:hypothetical protein
MHVLKQAGYVRQRHEVRHDLPFRLNFLDRQDDGR